VVDALAASDPHVPLRGDHGYGYRKASPARSNMMELVFDQLEHMWGVEIIRGVERVARQHRVGVVLTEFGPPHTAIRYWIDEAVNRRPACVVTVAKLSEEQRNQLRAHGIPFVVFAPTGHGPRGERPADRAGAGDDAHGQESTAAPAG
jgi:DNA-binding LacI/PurR family transcriptional regulator